MNIEIVSRDFAPTMAIRNHVEYRLARLLAWNARHLRRVRVTLGRTERAGIAENLCRITVTLSEGKAIRVQLTATDLYMAITKCVAQVERNVLDELRRRGPTRRPRGLGVIWS